MLREWIVFLDDFLYRQGLPGVAKAVLGILSFAGLLGALFGSAAVKSGALVAAVLLFTAMGIAVLSDRRSYRKELENHQKLVWHYCKVKNDQDTAFEVVEWDETFVINDRGDAHERVSVQVRPLVTDLWFVRLVFGCGWPQPARFRRKVQLSARHVLADGSPGISLLTTPSWRADGKMEVTVHLSRPPDQYNPLSVAVDVTWPRRCAPLVDGVPEEFSVRFKQPVHHARYKIALPAGVTTYCEPITEAGDVIQCVLTTANDGVRELVTFEAFDLPPKNTIGVRLEIREKLRRAIAMDGTP